MTGHDIIHKDLVAIKQELLDLGKHVSRGYISEALNSIARISRMLDGLGMHLLTKEEAV